MLKKILFTDHLFRSFFSIAASLAILGILVAAGLKSYSNIPGMVTVAGAFYSAEPVINEIYTFYALQQRWPDEDDALRTLQSEEYYNGMNAEYALEKGSLHIVIDSHLQGINGKTLSFRKAVFPDQPDASTLWLCGYQPVPPGMVVDVENRTDIETKYLIARCK